MPADLNKPLNVVDDIVTALTHDLAELQTAPTNHTDTDADRLARLQAQIFILTDAVHELTQAFIETQHDLERRATEQRRPRRRR